jgi:2-C-methyl-D-erythritol 4-phosphate cytidylyltransferase
MADVSVVIPAGGRGRRMGGKTPKQFLLLGGVPILERTIAAFHGLRDVREIVLVVPPGCVVRTGDLVRRAGFRKVAAVVEGGRERQASVFNGLKSCSYRSGIVSSALAASANERGDSLAAAVSPVLGAAREASPRTALSP